jgi:arginyl-tRNA synthetase
MMDIKKLLLAEGGILLDYQQRLAGLLAKYLPNIPVRDIYDAISTPPDRALGHYAYPCFKLAKELRKAPPVIAQELADTITAGADAFPPWFSEVRATGGYLNFFLNRASFTQAAVAAVLAQGERYGHSDMGNGKKVLVEYSSPNIAKHFHVGHFANTVIGRALANIFIALGYDVVQLNFLGDWGTQFGKLITAYKKWGDRDEIERSGIEGLTRLYVKFHEEADNDESLIIEARAWVVRMQDGDEEGLSLWRWFCDLSMKDFEKIYARLDIHFDAMLGESQYVEKMEAVARELNDKGLLVESEGARIVDLESYGMPPCLILRGDGGTLYATRDIASHIDRYAAYHFDKSIILTGNEQLLYFAQWIKVLELMGYAWAKDIVHITYGLFVFESGKMSTRRGQVFKIDEMLDEAVAKTMDIIEEKNPDLPDKEQVAEWVGVGALIFNQMYNSRVKDIMFSWERMLNFEGETGPYVQYTHARACSVLEKAGTYAASSDCALADEESFELTRLLYDYPAAVKEAAIKYEPF